MPLAEKIALFTELDVHHHDLSYQQFMVRSSLDYDSSENGFIEHINFW